MKVKETIAFIGEPDKTCNQLIQKLAKKNHPVVLVAKEENHFENLSRKILNHTPEADIEIVNCTREGCWEADIIILCEGTSIDSGLTEKMKEVANQKILVLLLNKEKQSSVITEEINKLRKDLPNTRLVQLIFNPVSKEMYLTGEDEAKSMVEDIFNRAGYTTSTL